MRAGYLLFPLCIWGVTVTLPVSLIGFLCEKLIWGFSIPKDHIESSFQVHGDQGLFQGEETMEPQLIEKQCFLAPVLCNWDIE